METNRMIKRNLLLLFFLSIAIFGSAQTKFGLKTGISVNQASAESVILFNNDTPLNIEFESYTPSLNYGIYFQKKFNWLFLETDVLFGSYRANYNISNFPSSTGPRSQSQEVYQELIVETIGGWTKGPYRIGVGPVVHKTIGFKSDFSDFDFYKENNRSVNMGFQFVAGLDLGPVSIDAKFEDHFGKIGNRFESDNARNNFQNSMRTFKIQLGIGF